MACCFYLNQFVLIIHLTVISQKLRKISNLELGLRTIYLILHLIIPGANELIGASKHGDL